LRCVTANHRDGVIRRPQAILRRKSMTGISDFRHGFPRCFHPMDTDEGAWAWQRKRNSGDLVRPTTTDRLTAYLSIPVSCGLHAQPRKKIAKRETFFRRSFMAKFMERNRNLQRCMTIASLSRNRDPLTCEGESTIPCPHGCKPPQRTSEPPRIGPLATTSKRPAPSGSPMLSASSPAKMPAKWRTTSLAFLPCCASGHSESGSVQDAESLRELRHLHGGSVEDCAGVLRQEIKCNLDAELICSRAPGLIQYAIVARGRT